MRHSSLLVLAVVLLAGCSTVPQRPEGGIRGNFGYVRDHLSRVIRDEMARHDVTGLSIALVDDQKVIWSEGFGYADRVRGIPATADTVYRAGSIAKLFTATAVMQLAEDRLVDIDQPLTTYLPDFSVKNRFSYASPITLRTLLTHHSGLPSDIVKGMWTRSPEPFGEAVNLLKEEYAATPPGYVFSYSNVGMTLAGNVVEKVSGREFATAMDLALLLPLRMTSSSFSTRPERSPAASKAYRDGVEADDPPLRDVPAGGLNTSVSDLSRFIAMVFAEGWAGDRQILRQGTLREMLRPQNAHVPLDLSFRVGLGWMIGGPGGIDVRNGGPVAHHGGATLYHRSQLAILPDHKVGVAVLANSASAAEVVNRVATEALALLLEAKTGITQRQRQEGATAQRQEERKVEEAVESAGGVPRLREKREEGTGKKPLTPEELKAFEGYYATIAGIVPVRHREGYLEADVNGRSFRLVPRPDGLLGMGYRVLSLVPVSLGDLDRIGIGRGTVDGREIVKGVLDGEEFLLGERLNPAPVPEKWLRRIGRYEVANPGEDTLPFDDVRVAFDGGVLTVRYTMPLFSPTPMALAVAPLSDTEAVISGLGRGTGETIRVVEAGKEERLLYSGYLLRKKE